MILNLIMIPKVENYNFLTYFYIFYLGYKWENEVKLVAIYFDTPGYDEITKDTAAKFVDMLSAIGGTFGLLTGFSLISAVEILYFIAKFLMSLVEMKKK